MLSSRFLKTIAITALCASTSSKGANAPASGDMLPLADVIKEVTAALKEYQDNRGSGASFELPPLSSAEFDFKTTVQTTVGVSFQLLIFKFGTSHERDVVNDVTYTYSLEPPKPSSLAAKKPPPSLKDQLAKTIQTAAAAVKTSSSAAGLPFSKLVVNVQYGVKWDIGADAKPVISLVTVDLNADVNKNTVQSVKLTFGK